MRPKRIRGGKGLGDAIYVRSLVPYLIEKGINLEVCTKYPDLFSNLKVATADFRRNDIDILAHYINRRQQPYTNQWQDVCIQANLPQTLSQKIEWEIKNKALVEHIAELANGRKVILVNAPRTPMARTDGVGMEILPDAGPFRTVVEGMNECLLVMIGKDKPLYEVYCELDLVGKTTSADLFDLAKICHGMIGQCSFIIPLAEAFNKPLLAIWSRKIHKSREPFIYSLLPEKVLAGESPLWIYDDFSKEEFIEKLDKFKSMI